MARELGGAFDLTRALGFGTLPGVWGLADEPDRKRALKAYALTYLREEIVAEQIVRNLSPFRRFLEVAASANGQIIQAYNIARDVVSGPKTVATYFDILEDTYTASRLPSYWKSVRKRQKKSTKCYFFDTGVVRALSGSIDFVPAPRAASTVCFLSSLLSTKSGGSSCIPSRSTI